MIETNPPVILEALKPWLYIYIVYIHATFFICFFFQVSAGVTMNPNELNNKPLSNTAHSTFLLSRNAVGKAIIHGVLWTCANTPPSGEPVRQS